MSQIQKRVSRTWLSVASGLREKNDRRADDGLAEIAKAVLLRFVLESGRRRPMTLAVSPQVWKTPGMRATRSDGATVSQAMPAESMPSSWPRRRRSIISISSPAMPPM